MTTLPEWQWTRINEKALARFVVPQRVAHAVGEATPENYKSVYPWDDDQVVEEATTARTDYDLSQVDRPGLAHRIYDRLRAFNVAYQLEPVGADDKEQSIRSPAQVLGGGGLRGEGTCLDLALLYAGACLERNLLPLVVVFEDHALTMVAVTHDRTEAYPPENALLKQGVATDGAGVRNLITGSSHLAVECTGFAASSTLPGRDQHGFLSFDEAVAAGTTAFHERKFRFAIQPLWLHHNGIDPIEQAVDPQHPAERAVAGTKRTDYFVRAVSEYSPALLQEASPVELGKLQEALGEVGQTYDAVREAITTWVTSALSDSGELDPALLANLLTGNLEADIHVGRGSCHRIREIHQESLVDLIDRAISDPKEQAKAHHAFEMMGAADEDMFFDFEKAGNYLQEEAQKIVDLRDAGDIDGAQARLASTQAEAARLLRAINGSRTGLLELQRKLVGK